MILKYTVPRVFESLGSNLPLTTVKGEIKVCDFERAAQPLALCGNHPRLVALPPHVLINFPRVIRCV